MCEFESVTEDACFGVYARMCGIARRIRSASERKKERKRWGENERSGLGGGARGREGGGERGKQGEESRSKKEKKESERKGESDRKKERHTCMEK